jgi:hypothetical protein
VTTKVLGPDGVERTLDVVKVLGPDDVVRTLDFIKILGPDDVVREVFTAGGGGGGDANPTYITPAFSYTSGKTAAATAYFTANSSDGVPTAYAWGILDGAGGSIVSGAATQTAQLRITASTLEDMETATFYCDMTIGGTVYRATCTMSRYWSSGGGFSPL